MLWSTAAVGVVLIGILGTTNYGGAAEELTFDILTSGTMGLIFVGFGILAGIAAPVALILLVPVGKQQQGILMISAVLILVGSAALRYAILMAPQQVQALY
jgi:formate-dependent nitrite reductase membrane component NrfD